MARKQSSIKPSKQLQKQIDSYNARPKTSAEKPLKIQMGFRQAMKKVAHTKSPK